VSKIEFSPEFLNGSESFVRKVEEVVVAELDKVNDYLHTLECPHCGKKLSDKQ
jgi:hypothetical protein